MFFIVHEHIRWTMLVQHPMEMHLAAAPRQQCRWWFYQSWERSLVLWQRPRTFTRGSFWDLSFDPKRGISVQLPWKKKSYLSLGLGGNICFVSCMFLLGYWHLKSFLIFFDPSPTTDTFQIGRFPVDQKFCSFFSKEVTPQLMVELEELVPPYVPWIISSCVYHEEMDLMGNKWHPGQK